MSSGAAAATAAASGCSTRAICSVGRYATAAVFPSSAPAKRTSPPALRQADGAVSGGGRRLRRDAVALPMRLRRRDRRAAASAERRVSQELRLSVPPAAQGSDRSALRAAHRAGIRRKAEQGAQVALPLRLRQGDAGAAGFSNQGADAKLRLCRYRHAPREHGLHRRDLCRHPRKEP